MSEAQDSACATASTAVPQQLKPPTPARARRGASVVGGRGAAAGARRWAVRMQAAGAWQGKQGYYSIPVWPTI